MKAERMKRTVLAVLVVLLMMTGQATASPFTDCGVLVQGAECGLFQADGGGLYVLENWGDFHVGDCVCVSGMLDPDCTTFCMQGDGCITDNTISPCQITTWTPDSVEIVPENPTSADIVDITFSGIWPDSCIPSSFPIEVTGNDIYFSVISDTNDVCTQVPTPWELTESVGSLPPGTYSIYASLDRGPWTLVTEFYVAEADVYVFVPGQSTLVKTGGPVWVHETYTIEGWFQLTVDWDANTASFDEVYGDLYYDGVPLDTTLDILLRMTEMVSTAVSDTVIEFESNSLPGGITGELTLTFEENDSVHLTGTFVEPYPDGFQFDLDAIARKKIVSGEVSWIAGESGPADWRVEPNCASTSDIIHFFGPTAIFANACVAEWDMGYPKLTFDPVNKTIELWFQPSMHEACPNVWEPVCGLEGSFGPLEVGQWLFFGNDPNATFSISFQVDSTIDSNSIVDNGIKYYMRTDKSVYKLDEQVEMLYRVTNLTPNSVDIGNILNCEDAWTHFAITDYDNTDIWQFFRINPPCGYVMFSLDPYESRECQMVWDMTNDNGTLEPEDDFPVGPGLYNITGELELGGGYQRVPVSVTIEIIPFVYVDADATGADDGSSWANAYTSLPYALDVVSSGYEIRVAQGTYRPNDGVITTGDERELTFQLKNDVTVKGGYAGFGEPDPDARDIETYETILSGDLYGNDGPDFANNGDNSYHVVTGSGTDATAVLDGFTITGGNAPYGGGGMYNYEGDPRLTNCTFISNSAEYLGGGMYNYKSSPAVTNCTFSGNSGGGGGGGMTNRENSSPTVTNCIFSENSAPGVFISGGGGGGMYNDTSSPIVTNCIFSGNSAAGAGGGISNWWGANPTISNCTFSGNSADVGAGMGNQESTPTLTDCRFNDNHAGRGGGMYNTSADPTLTNCEFTGNSAVYGGGMSNWFNEPVLINCLFSGNSAQSYGGGMDNFNNTPILTNCTFAGNVAEYGGGIAISHYCHLTLTNCIFWGNNAQTDPEIWESEGIIFTVSYSDIQGGWPGIGNIDADPCFADPNNGDYHLKSEGWRWSKYLVHDSHWWCDYVTSPCIDAGNPGSPLGDELLTIPDDPNHDWGVNLRINMGAYGGTAEASMPPYGWALLGDLSNDGTIDYEDLAGQIEDWLTTASQQPGDLNRDGIVNMADFALLAQDWLAKTSWYEPPIVLEIYSCNYPKLLLDKITMAGEGEITISVEGASCYSIYALREGYYTELYYCQKGDTIDVDLDEIIHDKFNGVIFMSDVFFADQYLENTDVNVLDGNTPGSTIVAQFQTDSQGRFAIDPLAPGIYYFEFTFDSIHHEEVEIQGQYQDFVFPYDAMVDKPNIYLYPEETIEVDVNIVFPHGGHVTTSVPDYGTGWHITVEPSGVINGEFPCLFYEASVPDYGQYEAGWVVAQDQLEDFFRNNMALTGFNQKEIDDFIEYWIPRLTEYPYYAIYPQYNDELEEMIKLKFSTQPANLIRLIYSVRGLQTDNINLQQPIIPAFTREGFTVAEWGVILK